MACAIAIIVAMSWVGDDRYVAGQEEEGITRSLDRSLEKPASYNFV